MSGRKDYIVTTLISEAESIIRATARQTRVQAARRKAALAASRLRNKAKIQNKKLIDLARESAKEIRERAKEQNKKDVESAKNAFAREWEQAEKNQVKEELVLDSNAVADDSQADVERLGADVVTLTAWDDVLHGDTEVTDFMATEVEQWKRKHIEATDSLNAKEIAALSEEAASIVDAARIRKEKQTDRESLVAKIVASMEEIGFFVDAPHLSRPSDPSSDVIITAVRGEERVESSVGLEDEVQSEWGDMHLSQCSDSFIEYVKQMERRGVGVQINRDDLAPKPKLKRAGEKDLPDQRELGGK